MTIQIKRGNRADIPATPLNGEPLWAVDSQEFFMGTGTGKVRLSGAPQTADYTLYVATTALGGRTAANGAIGLVKRAGTTTSAAANKLIDSGATFDNTYLNKTVRNKNTNNWAKVTVVDSAQQLTLSADIMPAGHTYDIADAFDNIQDALVSVVTPYQVNVTIRVSPGAFAGNVVVAGLYPAKNVVLTLQGDTVGTTTVSGTTDTYIPVTVSNITFSNKVDVNAGSSVIFNTCVGSGVSKFYTYGGGFATYNTCTLTLGNDPGAAIFNGGTITKGYTLYVATASKGGSTTNDGLLLASGTNTSVSANQLVDSAASFTSALVGKTVFNTTDGTTAIVNAYVSATTLTLGADIFTATGKSYSIASAITTIQGGINAIPGSVNCDTTVQVSNETFSEAVNIWGKNFSGTFGITVQGLRTINDSGTASSGANPAGNGSAGYGTLTDTTKAWTVNGYQNLWVEITGGTGVGQIRPIHSNTATVLTITGRWDTAPGATSTYKIFSQATTIQGSGLTHCVRVDNGQKSVNLKYLKLVNGGGADKQGGVMIFNSASCNISYCHIENGSWWNVQVSTGATATITGCVGKLALIGDLAVDAGSSVNLIKQCRFTGWRNRSIHVNSGLISNLYQSYLGGGTGAGTICIHVYLNGVMYTDAYLEIDGSPSHNISIFANGTLFINGLYGALTTQVIKNAGGWGILSASGGFGSGVSSLTYSGNTSGTYSPTTPTAGGNS